MTLHQYFDTRRHNLVARPRREILTFSFLFYFTILTILWQKNVFLVKCSDLHKCYFLPRIIMRCKYFKFPRLFMSSYKIMSITNLLGIVPFVATLLKGRFVVFLKWILTYFCYIGLGDCPAGLEQSRRG